MQNNQLVLKLKLNNHEISQNINFYIKHFAVLMQ